MNTTDSRFNFDEKLLSSCDQIAEEHLGNATRKKLYPEYKSVLYKHKTVGDYMLVCADGSMLYAPYEIGVSLLINGFKNGLRSGPSAVKHAMEDRMAEMAA